MELTKKEYFLTIAASLFGGIIIGFVFAPKRTRHLFVGCNNGSKNNGNGYKNGLGRWDDFEDMDDMDDMEEMDGFDGEMNLKIEDEELSFH